VTSLILSRNAPTATGVISGGAAAPLAAILRGFDGLRRAVALGVCGTEGAGVGYDVLEIDREAISSSPSQTTWCLSAMPIGDRPGAHEVEYSASILPAPDERGGRSRTVVRARGWTITPAARTGHQR